MFFRNSSLHQKVIFQLFLRIRNALPEQHEYWALIFLLQLSLTCWGTVKGKMNSFIQAVITNCSPYILWKTFSGHCQSKFFLFPWKSGCFKISLNTTRHTRERIKGKTKIRSGAIWRFCASLSFPGSKQKGNSHNIQHCSALNFINENLLSIQLEKWRGQTG